MKAKTRPVPAGHHTATPYLVVHDAVEAIDFYKRAFGAKEVMRIESSGKIGHAQIRIGNSHIMISDEHPEAGALSPKSPGGSPARTFLYVRDVDTFVGRAVAIGATLRQTVDEKVYGDRSGSLEDPFGHVWHVATHRNDLSAEEIQRRTDFNAAAPGKEAPALRRGRESV
jgi:PhnB protein